MTSDTAKTGDQNISVFQNISVKSTKSPAYISPQGYNILVRKIIFITNDMIFDSEG